MVLDFGMAAELERQNATFTDRNIAGTPAYMSPEQALGEKPSSASDLFTHIDIGERAHAFREAGVILELKQKPAKALRKLQQSLAIAEKLDDQWNRALTLKEIGQIEKLQGVSGYRALGEHVAQRTFADAQVHEVFEKLKSDA